MNDMSTKLKILHAADLHLDSPFEGLSAGKAALRRGEQRRLLSAMAELVRERDIDLVLLSGDLLDSDCCYQETGFELLESLRAMAVPVFIAPGNHDFYSPHSPYARLKLPENVYIFRENRLQYVDLPELSARIWGAAYTDRYCAPLLRGFQARKEAGRLEILCLHGEVCTGEGNYCPISPDDLAASGLDYAALGHVHLTGGLRKAGDSYYSWPGCPEGRGFDECGEKYVNIIELEEKDCALSQVSLAFRRYEQLKVDVTGSEPLLAVHTLLPDDTVRDIYRIELTGECEKAPDLAALQAELGELFFHLQLRDRTRPRTGLWDKASEDSLRGLFLSRLRERYDACETQEEKALIEQTVRWGLAALDNGEEVVIHEDK